MLEFNNLLFEKKSNGIAIVTLNRPSKLNALNIETIQEIDEAIKAILNDAEITGAILTGSGEKAFAAGADISEIAELNETKGRKFAEKGQEVFDRIEGSSKPIIAVVNGFALGGGCELAMACHIRIGTAKAVFGQPEVNLGLIPGYGGTQRLTHLVGKAKALELMMTADSVKAEEALRLGLISYLFATTEEAFEKAEEILLKIAQKAPVAIGLIVDCVMAVYDGQNGYQTEANAFSTCIKTEDFKEGTKAFLEKRKATFQGK